MKSRSKLYGNFVKPLLDRSAALLLLLILLPLIFALIFLLLVGQKSSPFFTQDRAGFKGRRFRICKFKTMSDPPSGSEVLLSDEERITVVGRFLRRSSLDELPQLINVLKGEMSLVGPRPLHMSYLPLYSQEQARRHEVRPGITGLAQVEGRNHLSWEEKFRLDVYYADNLSFLLDLRILVMTVFVVLFGQGVSSRTCVTMEAFKGKTE